MAGMAARILRLGNSPSAPRSLQATVSVRYSPASGRKPLQADAIGGALRGAAGRTGAASSLGTWKFSEG